jgi:hypothetical protein
VKVWKSVGAVAIYSPSRAAGIAGGTALVLAGAGLGVGLAIADDGGGAQAQAQAPAAVTTKTVTTPASPQSTHARAAAKRAYARGFAAGSKRQAPALAGLGTGGPYVVRASRSSDGTLRVIQAVQLQNGKTYWLCSGGSRLCVRSGG